MIETVRIDMEVPKEEFENLKGFIDEWKKSRRDSKRYYGTKIFEMAKNWKQVKEQDLHNKAVDYRKVEGRIKNVLQDS